MSLLQQETFKACCLEYLGEDRVFEVVGKFSLDGAGAQQLWHQLVDATEAELETPHLNPNKVDTIILACYCITLNGKMIWENPVPNGVAYARPVALICGKEECSLLQEEHQFWELYLGEYSVNVTHQDGQVKVTFNTECTMVDGKMVSLLQGDSGHCCTVTKDEGNSPDAIENGFPVTKDFQTCMETWEHTILQ